MGNMYQRDEHGNIRREDGSIIERRRVPFRSRMGIGGDTMSKGRIRIEHADGTMNKEREVVVEGPHGDPIIDSIPTICTCGWERDPECQVHQEDEDAEDIAGLDSIEEADQAEQLRKLSPPAQHEGDTCPVHEDDDAPRVILVTIGRSFLDPATGKNLPMTGVEWRRFKRLVRNLLERHGALLFDGDGDGIWDGNIETAHAFLYAPKGPQAYVKLALGSYAHQFGQEAIGWVDGRTEFLTP